MSPSLSTAATFVVPSRNLLVPAVKFHGANRRPPPPPPRTFVCSLRTPTRAVATPLSASSTKTPYTVQDQDEAGEVPYSVPPLPNWGDFSNHVYGEWDEHGAEFTNDGIPIELPENIAPDAFREWGVQVFDWQTQCSTHADTSTPKHTYKLLPTAGFQPDAAKRHSLEERTVGGIDNMVSSFAHNQGGHYVSVWNSNDVNGGRIFELEQCLFGPRDQEAHMSVIQEAKMRFKRNTGSSFFIGFLSLVFTILVVVARKIIVRKSKQNHQGSVADLVKRGQLRSDRRGLSKPLKYEDPFNNPLVKRGKNNSTLEFCGKVYRIAPVTLTEEQQSNHQKRRSRAYNWKRPTTFLKEGDDIPPDVDPDRVRWIPANHPFATTMSDIDEKMAQSNVNQKDGVPFRIRAEHEALQRKLEALQSEQKLNKVAPTANNFRDFGTQLSSQEQKEQQERSTHVDEQYNHPTKASEPDAYGSNNQSSLEDGEAH